ncbi:hypothetical protein RHGRI_001353 [Rhododendron griersonianum]|nr:hypothetical protein RHGRI_001353 [Rhododendron griersonianum]
MEEINAYFFKLGLSLLTQRRRQDLPVRCKRPLDRMELQSLGPFKSSAAATTRPSTSVAAAEPVSAASATSAASPAAAAAGAALDGSAIGAGDVDGLGAAAVVLFDHELDGFALAEAAEALGLDRGLVDEEIVAAVVGGDEAESLLLVVRRSGCARLSNVNYSAKEVLEAAGASVLSAGQQSKESIRRFQSPFQLTRSHGAHIKEPCFARTFASTASEQERRKSSEARKDISKVEDPFDAPTYNIPEKPVTFTEGASYSVIILAGLGIAAAAGYAVFKELIFQPKE